MWATADVAAREHPINDMAEVAQRLDFQAAMQKTRALDVEEVGEDTQLTSQILGGH